MPQTILTLSGSYTTQPQAFPPSAAQNVGSPISETSYLQHYSADTLDLTVDTPVVLPYAGLTNCHFMYFKTVGGKVRVRITSADGSQQAIPVDSLLILYCASVPVTAIDFTRVTGTATSVTYLIGENQ